MAAPVAIAPVTAASALGEARGEGTQGRRITVAVERVLAALEAAGARPELLRELRGLSASQTRLSFVLPADGSASLIAAGRPMALPAALADRLLSVLAAPAGPGAAPAAASAAPAPLPSTVASAAPDASLIGRLLAAATGAAPRQHALLGAALETPVALGQRAVLLAEPGRALDVMGAAGRLRYTLEMSGLFYESHLKQWLRGQRSEQTLREELARLPPPSADRDGSSAVPGGAERVVAQLALSQRDVIELALPAWPGQPLVVAIEREAGAAGGGQESVAAVYNARLVLELPRLGRVEAQLRLAGDSVAVQLVAPHGALLASELDQLSVQLAARGLKPVSLVAEDAP
ncbi:MAG: flagellar hook-length control protein FliK [Burkholderiaceae bacterium]